MANHYTILGVNPRATQKAIKQAYREQCKQTHPDAGGSHEAFINVNTAYQVLSDPIKRQNYNLSLNTEPVGAGSAQNGPLFGGAGSRPFQYDGEGHRYSDVNISMKKMQAFMDTMPIWVRELWIDFINENR